ncbi:MAG: FG-GAP repeat protein [Alphaproteobacteria bacterium]|nr:FG-GAP repeat protein [Alphaproteobacteria bacterium]
MLLTLIALLACKDAATTDSATPPQDLDQDGYVVGEDCDDTNRLANPAAPELCDGVDNDCDGEIDEPDAADAPTWYVDVDGDGVGMDTVTERSCEAPAGFAAQRGDCDDFDERRSPLLEELCDGIDNDCDLAVDEPDAADAGTWYPDEDEDGYGDDAGRTQRCEAPRQHVAQGGDCDDRSAAVHPDADELCDGLDNDCDGVVDPVSALDVRRWYADQDGDGYGLEETELLSCDAPGVAWSSALGDCDDQDGGVHPGAMELCDGVDDDCDGVVDGPDSADALEWFPDSDGDGYGDSNLSRFACEQPSGSVAVEGDCDDTNGAVSPSASEVCGDGLDNDCDGLSAPGCGPGGERSLVDADASFPGAARNDAAGSSLAGVGDVDGDGLGDLIIGAPTHDYRSNGDGGVWLMSGASLGTSPLSGALASFGGDASNDALGSALAGLGDLDGDGYADFALGARSADDGATDAGAVYLFLGPVSGDFSADEADVIWLGAAQEDYAGGALAGGMDFDGDGTLDLAIGALGSDLGGDYGGAVFVLGAADEGGDLGDATAIFHGEGRNDRAGDDLAGAGDLNGDGLDDLIVGALGDDDAGTGAGAAYILHGPMSGSGSLANADAKLVGEAWYDYAGDAVAGGHDVDGDGYDDLLIGAKSSDRAATDAGAIYLVLGPVVSSASLSTADGILLGEADYDYAGYDVAMPGDVNADGFADLLVGAHYEDSGGNAAGAAYLVLGPLSGQLSLSDADAKLTGVATDDEAGAALAGAGDVNDDGYIDLLVGAPGLDGSATDSGGAYLILGGPGF